MTFKEVEIFIQENSQCKLLSKEYIKTIAPLTFECVCGAIFVCSFDSFRKANQRQCKKCGFKRSSEKQSLDYFEIKNRIEEDGRCKLLSTSYSNSKEKLEILCSCGEIFLKSFDAFRSGQRQCNKCSDKSRIEKRSLSFDFVKDFIHSSSSCLLVSTEYVNSHSPLEIRCACGELFITDFDKFKTQNKRKCNKCSGVYVPSFEEVQNEIEKYGCTLLSTYYLNNRAKLEIICPCGNNFSCTYEHFKLKEIKVCQICATDRASDAKRHEIEEVRDFIIRNGCTPLFNTYKNNRQKLDMLCKCGRFFQKPYHDFKDGNKRCCIKCSKRMSKGELEIERVLISSNMSFKFQYKFDDCKNKKSLPFDFGIYTDKSKTQLKCLVEFQGHQHYQVVDFGGTSIQRAEKEFELRQKNDKIKYDYCINNNIKLITIPFWDYDNIERILTNEGISASDLIFV